MKCSNDVLYLGPPVVPFYQLFWGRVPPLEQTTEKKGTLILTSLLEDLDDVLYIAQMHSQLSQFLRTSLLRLR